MRRQPQAAARPHARADHMRTRQSTTKTATSLAAASAAAAAALALNACAPGLNNSTTLGTGDHAFAISTIDPESDLLLQPIHTADDRPSVSGADRSHWKPIVFNAPNSDVQHFGQFSTSPNRNTADHRAMGEFPNAHTALNSTDTEEQRRTLAFEALLAPVYAGLDVILAPVRFFVDHPSEVRTSPDTTYQRVPRSSLGLTQSPQQERPE